MCVARLKLLSLDPEKKHLRLNSTPTHRQTLSQAHWQSKPVESILSSTPIRASEKGQLLHSFDLTFVSFAQPCWYRSSIYHRKWKQLEAAAMPRAALMPSPLLSYVSSDFCLWPLNIIPALLCSDCLLTDTCIALSHDANLILVLLCWLAFSRINL